MLGTIWHRIQHRWFLWRHKCEFESILTTKTRTKFCKHGIYNWTAATTLHRCQHCGRERLISHFDSRHEPRIRTGKAVEKFKQALTKRGITIPEFWDYHQFSNKELEDDQREETNHVGRNSHPERPHQA